MWRPFFVFFTHLFDTIIPPKASALTVRTLTLAQLHTLMRTEVERGMLPYHNEHVRALVWEIKYRKNQKALALAGQLLGEAVLSLTEEELGTPLLIPIPMHSKRKKKRGHNQTELLAEALLPHTQNTVLYAPYALYKEKYTPPQQTLSKHARLKNIKNSMRARDNAEVRGRTCIVLDDVTTTGATFTEATRALKSAGAAKVLYVALAG